MSSSSSAHSRERDTYTALPLFHAYNNNTLSHSAVVSAFSCRAPVCPSSRIEKWRNGKPKAIVELGHVPSQEKSWTKEIFQIGWMESQVQMEPKNEKLLYHQLNRPFSVRYTFYIALHGQ